MFIEAVLISIVIGYILKGRIANIDVSKLKLLYLPFWAFAIEILSFIPVRKGIIDIGPLTYAAYGAEYLLIFLFIYANRKNRYILIMGLGFLLNALPIFTNGGTMPVSLDAVKSAGLNHDVSLEGLYSPISSSTRLWFLGDIICFKFIKFYIISIGDIVSAVGLMLFILSGMTKKQLTVHLGKIFH